MSKHFHERALFRIKVKRRLDIKCKRIEALYRIVDSGVAHTTWLADRPSHCSKEMSDRTPFVA